jgi:hypothetical protein
MQPRSAGLRPFTRFGTVPLNTWIPNDENVKPMPIGWSAQYGAPPRFASKRHIYQTIMRFYDHPIMNKAHVIRRGDHKDAMEAADYEVYRAHQEYLHNKPMIKVKAQPLDFNHPSVQDRLNSMEDNSTVLEAINNFESKLSQVNLSPQKRDELRNQFYSKIIQADQSVIYSIAKDEQGNDIKSMLELLTKYNSDLASSRPNIIAPVAGTPDEVGWDDEEKTPESDDWVERMFDELDIGDGLTPQEQNQVIMIVKAEIKQMQFVGDQVNKRVLKQLFENAIENVRTPRRGGAAAVVEAQAPQDPDQLDEAAQEYVRRTKGKRISKMRNLFGGQPGSERQLINRLDGKFGKNPPVRQVHELMVAVLRDFDLENTVANRQALYDLIVGLE